MSVETQHTNRKIRYKFHGFGRPPNQLDFTIGENTEGTSDTTLKPQKTTVEQYFADKYKVKLKYPHLPCIDARNGPTNRANYLPMEVVKVSKLEFFLLSQTANHYRSVGIRMATSIKTIRYGSTSSYD